MLSLENALTEAEIVDFDERVKRFLALANGEEIRLFLRTEDGWPGRGTCL